MKDEFCSKCQHSVVLGADGACPRCGATATAAAPTAAGRTAFTIRPATRPRVMAPVHLALAVDGTGSTKDYGEAVRGCAQVIFDEIGKTISEVKVHQQVHGDHDYGQSEVLVTDGGTPAQALADLGMVTFEGGGDPAEHHLTAVERLVERVPWEPGAQRAMVVFTTDDTKPAHSGRSAAEIGKDIEEARILFYLVGHPTPTMLELVRAAGGVFIEISKTPNVDEMKRIGAKVGQGLSATLTKLTATRPVPSPTK